MKIVWSVDDIIIKEISERERIEERTGERLSYKVVKFIQKKGDKRSCLCFSRRLSQKLGVGLCCSLGGEVSFGNGSTYLVLQRLTSLAGQEDAGVQA